MLAESPVTDDFDLADEQRLASLELAAPHLAGYEVVELIGEGTYGDVWKARQSATGVIVAIKRLRKQPDAQSCAEVEKLARLGSARGIVALREVHLATEPYCYVMEHLEGGTLADLIRRERKLPFADAWRIFRQLNEALAYVHGEGIVHCDIKPENILLDARGNARLGDFGQARGRGPGGAALGTRFYMPPEQARLEGIPDPRWDVYALGGVLYEMLTGIKPRFDVEVASLMSSPTGSGSEVRDRLEKYARHLENCPLPQFFRKVQGLDSTTARLIDDCLSLEFSDRPQDAAAVLKRIAQCEHARASKPLLIFGGLAPAIMLLAVALVLYGVGLFTLSNVEQQWDQLIESYFPNSGPRLAEGVASTVEGLFNTRAEIVRSEASNPEVIALLGSARASTKDNSQIDERLTGLFGRHQSDVYRWTLADADGTVVANYGKVREENGRESIGVDAGTNRKNFAWRGWFNGVIDRAVSLESPRSKDLDDFHRRPPNQAFVAQPYSRKGDSQFVVIGVSCPITAEGSPHPVGVVSAIINYEDFFRDLEKKVDDLDEVGQQIVIVNQNYQVLFHSDKAALDEKAGKPFVAHPFQNCEHFVAALATDVGSEQPETQPGAPYIDPVTGQRCWGAYRVVVLNTGQRLAIFVQQQNPIRALWNRASWLAGGLSLMGVLFLVINGYALYWTIRQQEASAVRSSTWPLPRLAESHGAAYGVVGSEGTADG